MQTAVEEGYIRAYRSFDLTLDDDGGILLTSIVADFQYPGPVARETRKPSEGRDMRPESGFYAVKDPDDHYPRQGKVFAEVDLFGEVVEGRHGYRAEGLIIRKLKTGFGTRVTDMLADRYQCEVVGREPDDLPPLTVSAEEYEFAKAFDHFKRGYPEKLNNRGHRVRPYIYIYHANDAEFESGALKCKLCGEKFNWHVNKVDREIRTDPVTPCSFDPKRSATSWLRYIEKTPQSWEDCNTLFEVKQGGDPNSTKVGHETYVERRSRQGDKDAFAIRYHSTDIITFEPDGTIYLKTNGWYTRNTKQRLRDYLPDGYKVYSDGKLYGKLRWYVSTPWSRAQSKGPGTYELLVEDFRIGPRGEIKGQEGTEARWRKEGYNAMWNNMRRRY